MPSPWSHLPDLQEAWPPGPSVHAGETEEEQPVKTYSREELERILVRHYRGSTFNTCEHQQLPYMSGSPPLEIKEDPKVRPFACHTPAAVPAHWRDQVKKDHGGKY